jgi:hypothetical protein
VWTVTSQTETMDLDQTGNAVPGWKISFMTASGQSGSVFVPNTVYSNVDVVKKMISDRVATITAIAGLTG